RIRFPEIEGVELLLRQISIPKELLSKCGLQRRKKKLVFTVVFQNPLYPVIAESTISIVENIVFGRVGVFVHNLFFLCRKLMADSDIRFCFPEIISHYFSFFIGNLRFRMSNKVRI